MTVGVIELNDAGLRYGVGDNIIIESPGVSLVSEKQILLGAQAMQQARLHPVQTNNLFWHRLSAEPLNTHSNFCRHHADLAYSQLLEIHQAKPDCNNIIFAIPSSFSREQMSLLLGIVGQCPFKAIGIVDSALAAASLYASQQHSLHIDLQLHQSVFTQLTIEQESGTPRLKRGQVEVLPNTGMISILDQWAKKLADHFVDQTRFDPFYSAETEQSLYDQIPRWLQLSQQSNELVLEVNAKTIKLTREQFVSPLLPIYQSITFKAEQLLQLTGSTGQVQLLISDRLATLPGLLESLNANPKFRSIALPNNAVLRGGHSHADLIGNNGEHLQFVLSLPAQSSPTNIEENVNPTELENSPSEKIATHCLIAHSAYPIDESFIFVNENTNHSAHLSLSKNKESSSLFGLQKDAQGILLTPFSADRISINGNVINDNCSLSLGDKISISNHDTLISLINVTTDNGA